MPCGPLQAMWLVALASGNPLSGALSMFFFSLGTLPLMLALSSIISVIGKKYAGVVMKTGSLIVVVMGLSMISQAFALGGIKSGSINSFEKKVVQAEQEKQVIKSKLSAARYPNITVKKGTFKYTCWMGMITGTIKVEE